MFRTVPDELTASSSEFSNELSPLHELDFDLASLYCFSGGCRVWLSHELVRIADVLLKLIQRGPLAHHASHFAEPANIPAIIQPVLERELAHGPIIAPTASCTNRHWCPPNTGAQLQGPPQSW